jgi:4-hydroxythreonine-4-phosphate dehydrogenase
MAHDLNAVKNQIRNFIGISSGDVTGIGPEVALKAVAAEAQNDGVKYLFIGDEENLQRLNKKLSLKLQLKKFSDYNEAGFFFTTNPLPKKLPENLSVGSPISANASIA